MVNHHHVDIILVITLMIALMIMIVVMMKNMVAVLATIAMIQADI